MGEFLLGDLKEEVIQKACFLAMKAHKSEKQWVSEEVAGSSEVVVAFGGSWSVVDWFSTHQDFGQTNINLDLFPSLKRIRSSNKPAIVNEAFLTRFQVILETCSSKKTASVVLKKTPSFQEKVEKAISKKQKIVFAGHSSGGPVAIFATLWFLENQKSRNQSAAAPCCVTFGSPLVGDRILTHALRRENWARYFIHFVTKYDIVPRLTLAPLSSVGPDALQKILHFFDPKSPCYQHESIFKSNQVLKSVMTITGNASAVASHDASYFMIMGHVNSLLTTISSFHQFSPYRPFGTFIFCAGNGKLAVVKNPDAVLQIMAGCSQLSNEAEVAHKSLSSHIGYEMELEGSLQMQTVAYLDSIKEFHLSSPGNGIDLVLSPSAVLCILAAEEKEKRKLENQKEIDSTKKKLQEKLREIQSYRTESAKRGLGYYDAFKLQDTTSDFKANVNRLELAKIWDVIIEMLKNQDLPDEFESREDWIKLGTEFRQLVEPLDISNYYRHSKNNETESYLGSRGRPTRYKYTERWLEHSMMPSKLRSGSCFWAKIEELRSRGFEDAKEEIVKIERDVLDWISEEEVGKDVFLKGSTFTKWWNTLPEQHRLASVLKEHIGKL